METKEYVKLWHSARKAGPGSLLLRLVKVSFASSPKIEASFKVKDFEIKFFTEASWEVFNWLFENKDPTIGAFLIEFSDIPVGEIIPILRLLFERTLEKPDNELKPDSRDI